MYKNILVAVDGSKASSRALDTAVGLAGQFGANLHIMHVVREMQVPLNPGIMDKYQEVEKQRHDLLRSVGDEILSQASMAARSKGIDTVETDSGSGDPATAIAAYADKNNVDLVVIGSRGHGKVQSMLLGSVSRKVSELTKAACLIVK